MLLDIGKVCDWEMGEETAGNFSEPVYPFDCSVWLGDF
jgi:hypothetical protein